MEASQLKFTAETTEAINQVLSASRRKQLRREAVIAYIESKPAGTPIPVARLIDISGIRSHGSGSTFIKKMIADGLIAKIPAEGKIRGFSWAVLSHATYEPPKQKRNVMASRKDSAYKLRRKTVFDLIESKPAGTEIRVSEFANALGMGIGGTHNMLKKLQTTGFITREPATGRKSIYTYTLLKRDFDEPVVEAVTDPEETTHVDLLDTTQPENIDSEAITSPSEDEDKTVVQETPNTVTMPPVASTGLDWIDVKLKARSFAWDFNSDSLREFIKWVSQ